MKIILYLILLNVISNYAIAQPKNNGSLLSVVCKNIPNYHTIVFTFSKPLLAGFTASTVNRVNDKYVNNKGIWQNLSGCNFRQINFTNIVTNHKPTTKYILDDRVISITNTNTTDSSTTYRIGYCQSSFYKKTVQNTDTEKIVTLWYKN